MIKSLETREEQETKNIDKNMDSETIIRTSGPRFDFCLKIQRFDKVLIYHCLIIQSFDKNSRLWFKKNRIQNEIETF